ncbi:MAG: carotenoid oxygenase family protein [Candidatus Cyclobacteriaceae bacterium M3_2C_046]
MNVLKAYLEATKTTEKEYYHEPLIKLSGNIPAGLNGTLIRNGNGNQVHMGTPYQHVFDGDGMINKFQIDQQEVQYSNAYVKTREFVEETKAGKMLYRSFGTNRPGGWIKNIGRMHFKNAANTNLIWWGGKLLALWEGGTPHEIDPETLITRGRYDYEGVLQNNFSKLEQKIQPEFPFAAHPKLLPDHQILFNFGTAQGRIPRLILYQVDQQGKCSIEQVIKLEKLSFTHDMVITNSQKRIFFMPPVSFSSWKTLLGTLSPVEAMDFQLDQPTRILIVDKGKEIYLETDFCFVFHFLNTFEQADGTIVVDALKMDHFPDAGNNQNVLKGDDQAILQAQPVRYWLNLQTKMVKQVPLADIGMELPAVHGDLRGKDYKYAYGIAATKSKPHKLLQEIVKLNVKTGSFQSIDFPDSITGEPVFVAKPGVKKEDEGWLLFTHYEAKSNTTRLVIAEAENLDILYEGQLPHNIPMGFHGTWVK